MDDEHADVSALSQVAHFVGRELPPQEAEAFRRELEPHLGLPVDLGRWVWARLALWLLEDEKQGLLGLATAPCFDSAREALAAAAGLFRTSLLSGKSCAWSTRNAVALMVRQAEDADAELWLPLRYALSAAYILVVPNGCEANALAEAAEAWDVMGRGRVPFARAAGAEFLGLLRNPDRTRDISQLARRGSWWVVRQALEEGKDVQIRYMDLQGRVTQRVIRPWEDDEGARVHAHCFLRGERRHFLYDRMIAAVAVPRDPDPGPAPDEAVPF